VSTAEAPAASWDLRAVFTELCGTVALLAGGDLHALGTVLLVRDHAAADEEEDGDDEDGGGVRESLVRCAVAVSDLVRSETDHYRVWASPWACMCIRYIGVARHLLGEGHASPGSTVEQWREQLEQALARQDEGFPAAANAIAGFAVGGATALDLGAAEQIPALLEVALPDDDTALDLDEQMLAVGDLVCLCSYTIVIVRVMTVAMPGDSARFDALHASLASLLQPLYEVLESLEEDDAALDAIIS
jgi:hypothetical protein